jgi:hypothetical protein
MDELLLKQEILEKLTELSIEKLIAFYEIIKVSIAEGGHERF